MSIPLSRNTRIFYTTGVSYDITSTVELNFIDSTIGFNSTTTEIDIDRSNFIGTNRSISTYTTNSTESKLKFSTYLYSVGNTLNTSSVLWNALLSSVNPFEVNAGVSTNTISTAYSNISTLLVFNILIVTDSYAILLKDCNIQSANMTLGANDLAIVSWEIVCKSTERLQNINVSSKSDLVLLSGNITGSAKYSPPQYLLNKFMYCEIGDNKIPLLSASLNINNNISTITNNNISNMVNRVNCFNLGARSITGSIVTYNRDMLFSTISSIEQQIYSNYYYKAPLILKLFDINGILAATTTLANTSFNIPKDMFNTTYTVNIDFTAEESINSAADELLLTFY